MKNNRFFLFTALTIVMMSLIIACAKETNEPEEEPPVASQVKFTWSINGGSTIDASDGYCISAYNEIIAIKTGATAIDIILEDLNKGSHAISPANGITLEYNNGSANFNGKSGSVTITENSGTTLAGTFNCSLDGNGGSLTGQFSNLPKK
ncbi:hypothetical protein [Aurantibacillus circumpalustris]|uniref:hypothetical protein n=1 Tax=Aurantibacillus circumpalustris TaxID=3036359 RepID=UPI00295C14DA|nr:hypothetical protein [Aurantibacillus circumpalustris]